MTRKLSLIAVLLATPALAQGSGDRYIQVGGTGIERTPPDVAMLAITLRGDGPTADAATAALAAKQKAVSAGLAGLLGATELNTGNVTISEVTDRACARGQPYGPGSPQSERCPFLGYAATVQASLRTRSVDKVGTAAGLAARLGALDARVTGFTLSDPEGAQRRATAKALADARSRAQATAAGGGVRLGRLMNVRDPQGFQPTVYSVITPSAAPAMHAPPPPPAPVALNVAPSPIETRATVIVTYAIED